MMAYFIMSNIPSTAAAAKSAVHVFRFFPPYNVGEGLIAVTIASYQNSLLGMDVNVLDWEVTGRNITFMAVEAVGFFLIVLLCEFPIWLKVRQTMDEVLFDYFNKSFATTLQQEDDLMDVDVRMEQEKVEKLVQQERLQQQQEHQHHHQQLQESASAISHAIGDTLSGIFSGRIVSSKGVDLQMSNENDLGTNENTSGDVELGPINRQKNSTDFSSRRNSRNTDSDVVCGGGGPAETSRDKLLSAVASRRSSGTIDQVAVLLHHLRKTYRANYSCGKSKRAVKDLSLALEVGERFGFLGQ